MKIILVNNDHEQTRSFQVTKLKLYLFVFLLVVIIGGISGSGMYVLLQPSSEYLLTNEGLRNWQETLENHKKGLASVKEEAEWRLDALTLRLAELQGRITRLDVLGERLAIKSNFVDGEFDFSDLPALGGPSEPSELTNLYTAPTLFAAIDQLWAQIDNRENQLYLLDSLLDDRDRYKDAFVSGLPVEKGWLSSKFGRRIDPFTGKSAWHNGIDYAGKRGSSILSMAAGVVIWASDRRSYGLLVEINHGNGYITRYAHNESIDVKVGDIVSRGQVLAKMGSSGRSTGDHVHIEVLKNGKIRDPAGYIYRTNSLKVVSEKKSSSDR